MRWGDWKLVVKTGKPMLYNLADDPHEDHDLAAAQPDIVRTMVGFIYREHTDSPLFPITLPQR